ncbi:MAG TPA: redoxin domain-containing protein [Phycisphaerae bacterium]|nr:redoxin domain-containing protein [Phycisphaerae bacterium]HOJ75496.1 redoxin domain-containing protein [Phycisphaerae bacterium]HOQ86757.1 redoxin domain-containing protein [Phycisphaerae bacterium]HPU28486.1 redoxin domain-containing protein [Phycisphaerae bacterium]HPZ98706.1 redoxin domain-containing protein [Phycisphaerae bacterium]
MASIALRVVAFASVWLPVNLTVHAADPTPIDASAMIIGDPAVQEDLRCTSKQKQDIRQLLDKLEQPIWVLRDWPPDKSRDRLAPLMAELQTGIDHILTPAQCKRFEQIQLQQRGPAALLDPDTSEAVGLSAHQNTQVRAVIEDTQAKLRKLGPMPAGEAEIRQYYRTLDDLRSREQDLLLAILDDEQKKAWAALRGKRFDLSRLQPLTVRAPELQDATAKEVWINSEPLSLAGVRGRVVIVHFWTFGCINCIRNYEWYKGWQRDFASKDVTLIGIHTPETTGERDGARLRAKVAEHGLSFPILIDNHRQNWDAWGNSMWPSVYLVDRVGRVRYWWYGELKWGGHDGEKHMRGRIEELLREPAPTSPPSGQQATPQNAGS